jgi:hypothetical protein
LLLSFTKIATVCVPGFANPCVNGTPGSGNTIMVFEIIYDIDALFYSNGF